MSDTIPHDAPVCQPPLPVGERPRYRPPAGACDAHVHVFGDPAEHPFATERSFTPPPGLTLPALEQLHRELGFDRAVIVQTGVQGLDGRLMLEALRSAPERLRGVAVLRGDVTDRALDEMHEAGMRGIRINLFRRAGQQVYRGGAGFADLEALAPRIRRLGWHVQAWLDANDLPELSERLLGFGLPVVIDHMGRITTDRGLDNPGFAHLCDLVWAGRVWCKLSCADRISVAGAPYADALPYARALLAANRERVVWGSDWPHVNYFDKPVPDDAGLVDMIPEIAPDDGDRRRLLVDNPAELYGFR